MRLTVIILFSTCCLTTVVIGNTISEQQQQHEINPNYEDLDGTHIRNKRTLFLKKKLIGAGLLGFGLGVAKGAKLGYFVHPPVHHVYSAPASRYVEYVEKPVFVQRIVEKPVFKHSHVDYDSWSPHEVTYGSW